MGSHLHSSLPTLKLNALSDLGPVTPEVAGIGMYQSCAPVTAAACGEKWRLPVLLTLES